LTQSEQAARRKIANIDSGHLKPHDYTGTLRDMVGNPVPKKTGCYWDHALDMNNSLQGLRKHVNTLRNSTDPAAVAARAKAEALIKKIVEHTEGAGL
jgi:filamentous hemagglutinin